MRRLIVIVAITALVGCGAKPSTATGTVNDKKDPNTTWKSTKPLTYAEAISEGKCPLQLPTAANNIQYVDFYAGFGGFIQFVRFEAPVSICRDHAHKVLETRNQSLTQTNLQVPATAMPLDRSVMESLVRRAREDAPEVARAPWFDADTIGHGEMWGTIGSHKAIILVDTDRGVFYYALSD